MICMRKFILFIELAAIVASSFVASGQHLGTKTPYAPSGHVYTPTPDGYAPVFIDYVGRHGARFLTKAGSDIAVLRIVEEADQAGGLTELGKKIKWAAGLLRDAGKGNYEQITILGREEQAAIGERMRLAYPGVFKGRGLDVVTTYKLRTQQSAEAFLKGLGKYDGPISNSRQPDSLDTKLRFYDLSPGYTTYKKGALIAHCMDSLVRDPRNAAVAKVVCRRVFTEGYLTSIGGERGQRFVEDLYDCYAISWSMRGELTDPAVTSSLGSAFGPKELEWLDMTNGAADFLEKGPGFDSLGIQVEVAVPLLVDFICQMDRAASGKGPDAVLQFTHAEAISPLAALMGIRGASQATGSIFGYRDRWQAEAVIPLSANIQWIVYSGRSGLLVKVLLNEREVALPVKAFSGPYYRWTDLRSYYLRKLESLGVSLDGDMLRYLQGL